jgi:phosphoenolpyruvate carboxykinase (ATP)
MVDSIEIASKGWYYSFHQIKFKEEMEGVMNPENRQAHYGLENHGIKNVGRVYWNPPTPVLYEEIVRRREGVMAHLGPIVVRTGHHTGRSPDDKRIVREKTS